MAVAATVLVATAPPLSFGHFPHEWGKPYSTPDPGFRLDGVGLAKNSRRIVFKAHTYARAIYMQSC